MVLYRELYEQPVSVHPYARYDALASELGAIGLAQVKGWYRRHVTPENAELLVAGDVEPAELEREVRRYLGDWRGPRPEPQSYPEPRGPESRRLLVVDRPGSTQSQIAVATLGPERASQDYPALMAATQIVGGGTAGRLFLDVREKRSLAYSTGAYTDEVAHGPMPVVLSAGTQTAKTTEAVSALLEHFARLGETAPTNEELERAARYLADSFLFRMETAGAIADLASRLRVLGLADESYDEYRAAVRGLEPTRVGSVAGRIFRKNAELVIVVGDAKVVAKPLTRFGTVKVLDPERDFVVRDTLLR
jgi:zinc protease